MFDLSPIQLILVLVIALLALGPRRLPEVGRTIGHTLREVRGIMSFEGAEEDTREQSRDAAASSSTVAEPPGPPASRPAAVGGEGGERPDAPSDSVAVEHEPPEETEPDAGPRPEDLVVRGRRER